MYSHVSTRNVIYIQACKRLVNHESIVKMLILQMLVEGIERLSSAWYNGAKKKTQHAISSPAIIFHRPLRGRGTGTVSQQQVCLERPRYQQDLDCSALFGVT